MDERTIYRKLLDITKEAQAIEKKGWNDYSKYAYIRAVDVIDEMHKLFVKHGIYLTINETELDRMLEGKNWHTCIKCEATFINVDKPEERHTVTYGSVSADTLDKDVFKAKTNGLKYLLTQQFLLQTDSLQDTESDKGQPSNDQSGASSKGYNTGNSRYPKTVYGICPNCDGEMYLRKDKTKVYCQNYKDGGDHPSFNYTGWEPVPEEIRSGLNSAKEIRKWFYDNNKKDSSIDADIGF